MTAIKDTPGRKVFNALNTILLLGVLIVTLYPILYVVAASLSSQQFLEQGRVGIIPMGTNIEAYRRVFMYPNIFRAYGNTVFYTVFGTAISLVLTILGAYSLSKKHFIGKDFFLFIIVFSMLFNGGIIPTFLVIKGIGFYNTVWSILLPSAVSSFNLIIMRTFFQQIPAELEESAMIDGASPVRILINMIIPLSKASITTIGLFYAVAQWNSFFPALLYLNDLKLQPIQIILRNVVLQNQVDNLTQDLLMGRDLVSESIKYAIIVVATLPIMLVYPFIQKYFVTGVMIGSVKG